MRPFVTSIGRGSAYYRPPGGDVKDPPYGTPPTGPPLRAIPTPPVRSVQHVTASENFPPRVVPRPLVRSLTAMEHFIVRTLVDHGYIAVFVLMMLQGTGIPIPSEVTMSLGGAAASVTFVAATLEDGSKPLVLAWVVAAGVAGDLTG